MEKKVISSAEDKSELNWDQAKDKIMMLNYTLSQIERSMTKGDKSIDVIPKLFSTIINQLQVIILASERLQESMEKTEIRDNCYSAGKKIREVMQAFQLYGKLAKSISHVSLSLSDLTEPNNDVTVFMEPKKDLKSM